MTTRAGILGVGTGGLLLAVLWYPLYWIAPGWVVQDWPSGSVPMAAGAVVIAAGLTVMSGWLAARWGGAVNNSQRIGLGAWAGGVAALLVFCGLGAAAAGTLSSGVALQSNFAFAPRAAASQSVLHQVISRQMTGTHVMFWGMLLAGVLLGAVGGGCYAPRPASPPPPVYNKAHPQMALNVSITAAPATALTVILAAAVFLRASDVAAQIAGAPLDVNGIWTTALLLYLAAHAALMLVTPHEARQADHQCGLDEVRVAAYVGIAAPLVLGAGLLMASPRLMLQPVVIVSWLVSLGMSARLVRVLRTLILPRRAQLPPPPDVRQAILFGSIAQSRWQNLLLLCMGCGWMMIFPLHVVVVSVALNLWHIPIQRMVLGAPEPAAELVRHLYQAQAGVSLGSMAGAGMVLAGMYLFYSMLGRWVQRRWVQRRRVQRR